MGCVSRELTFTGGSIRGQGGGGTGGNTPPRRPKKCSPLSQNFYLLLFPPRPPQADPSPTYGWQHLLCYMQLFFAARTRTIVHVEDIRMGQMKKKFIVAEEKSGIYMDYLCFYSSLPAGFGQYWSMNDASLKH